MILTPIPPERLPAILAAFAARLSAHPSAAAAFARIAATWPPASGVDTPAHRAAAVALAERFGLDTLDADPATGFSWDGRRLYARTEATVIVHEVAHWLIAPPARRGLPDFGLGAGPETGRTAEADAARAVDDATGHTEEVLTSLLGILMEAALGQPAILAFLEQNWLEAHERPATAAHFVASIDALLARGLIDPAGRPILSPTGGRRDGAGDRRAELVGFDIVPGSCFGRPTLDETARPPRRKADDSPPPTVLRPTHPG